ncbi:hypothetical protein KQ41_06625 [Lysinibacillus fusiformis]|nr:hypothetical protein KQ41_06625 [Lysinibacillus fusiformis]
MNISEILKLICLIISMIGMIMGGYNLMLYIQSNEQQLHKRKRFISLSYAIIFAGFAGYFWIL